MQVETNAALRTRIKATWGKLLTNHVSAVNMGDENPALVLAAIALNLFPKLSDSMDFAQLQAVVDAFDKDANEPSQDRL